MGGGIKNGIITDIYGASGTGKTQLVMQISLNSLQKGGNVLFQDTTGEFRPERMLELIKNRKLNSSLLDNVKVVRITNTGEQISNLSKIKKMDNFSLIIIDNVTDLFSFEYSKELQELEKRNLFMKYMHDLSLISLEKKIPIIVTNIVRKFDDIEKENLEMSISIFTHLKIKLMKIGTKYLGEILPTFHGQRQFSYLITKDGLVDSS